MAKDRNESIPKEAEEEGAEENSSKRDRRKKSKRKKRDESSGSGSSGSGSSGSSSSSSEESSTGSEDETPRSRRKGRRHRSSRRRRSSSSDSESDTDSESDAGESESEGEGEEKEKERKSRKKKEKDRGKKGAVTNSWGKYGIIRETDMWNKRPEFTAWLAEVKQVNLETLPNWEEKQMFKEFMEDHNTATFPSRKYYNLDAYHCHKMEKELKKGLKKVSNTERTIFNDEEQRRIELQRERERHKEEQVEALKRSMQGGMAQAMKEQARLKEEMAYQYRLGNFEAAAAIQRRLDPDVAM